MMGCGDESSCDPKMMKCMMKKMMGCGDESSCDPKMMKCMMKMMGCD